MGSTKHQTPQITEGFRVFLPHAPPKRSEYAWLRSSVQASHVLYNFIGGSGTPTLQAIGDGQMEGTILAPNIGIHFDNRRSEIGAIIGGPTGIHVTSSAVDLGRGPFTPPPGDVNYDGIVNGQDIALIASDWLQKGPNEPGDANGDGIVHAQDIAVVASYWLWTWQGPPSSGSGSAVPEPSSIALLTIGAICVAAVSYAGTHRRILIEDGASVSL
jgi:Dockerin type I domain/PEP-CTERM motif